MDETDDKKRFTTKKHHMRAKLIFNPSAGRPDHLQLR